MSLNYEVQVVHPTFNGQRIVRWDVIIHYIEKRKIKTITLESQNGDDNVNKGPRPKGRGIRRGEPLPAVGDRDVKLAARASYAASGGEFDPKRLNNSL